MPSKMPSIVGPEPRLASLEPDEIGVLKRTAADELDVLRRMAADGFDASAISTKATYHDDRERITLQVDEPVVVYPLSKFEKIKNITPSRIYDAVITAVTPIAEALITKIKMTEVSATPTSKMEIKKAADKLAEDLADSVLKELNID